VIPSLRNLLPGVLLVPALACTPSFEAPPAGGDATAAEDDASTHVVEIDATVRSNLGITFATVEARRVADTLRVPGAFELEPLARHEYRMALPGRVKLLVDQYDRVEPGTPLYRFQSPSWPELLHEIIEGEQAIETAKAEIEVGRAKITEARQRLAQVRERIAALARADFKRADLEAEAAQLEASLPRLEAELQLTETRLANARRMREHALHRASAAAGIPEAQIEEESLDIDWIVVHATEPGVVEALAVTDGAFVEPPSVVLSTVDPTRVRFRALALQSDLGSLAGAVEARIVPPQSPGYAIAEGVEATMAIGLEAHPQERTLTLLAAPHAHADWVRPGVSAFLEVVVESTDGAVLAIPRSAVVRDGLAHVFFRRDPADPNRAIRVEADLGVSDGRWVAVHSGVRRGDQVVLDGAYELKLATERSGTSYAGGHVHADGTSHADH
jgi:multidrug resistance efflux pump